MLKDLEDVNIITQETRAITILIIPKTMEGSGRTIIMNIKPTEWIIMEEAIRMTSEETEAEARTAMETIMAKETIRMILGRSKLTERMLHTIELTVTTTQKI